MTQLNKTKICCRCKIEQPLTEYYKNLRAKDNLMYHCRTCGNKKSKEWRLKNDRTEYYRDYEKNRRKPRPPEHYDKKRNRYLYRKYKLTTDEYELMFQKQNYKCKICNRENNPYVSHEKLCVDHCHKTNKIRGLLCSACNIALGKVNDKIDILQNMIDYLNENNNKPVK